jgi:hypothetical protein
LDGDTQILATLLKHIPESRSIDAADIELLRQDIPVQPPVVIPARSMQEAIQAEDMEVYLTVLRAHSREGHLQCLLSLEADLSTAAQDKGDGGEESESVAGSCIDKEGEAGACELGMQGRKTYAGVSLRDSNAYHHFAGKECLDVHMYFQDNQMICARMMMCISQSVAGVSVPKSPPDSALAAVQIGNVGR